jgi:AraC-like DNA-binding protein
MVELRVLGEESSTGWWEVSARPPAPPLRGLVTRYAGYREHSAVAVRRREVPTGQIEVIISFGPGIGVLDPADPAAGFRTRTSFVTAVTGRWAMTEYAGDQHGVQITMTPLAAGMVLGTRMGELGGGATADLTDFPGAEGRRLAERLAGAQGWAERFDMVDEFLLTRLSRAHAPSPAAAWAWARLRETDGRLSVATLAGEMACSTRYLSAQVRSHVGIGPKALARVLRVRRAIDLVEAGAPGLSEIAHACGYADQSHFGRDFLSITGVSPGAWTIRPLATIPEPAGSR